MNRKWNAILVFALAALCLLTSCKSNENVLNEKTAIVSGFDGIVVEGGRLYFNHGTNCLTFYDFALEQNIPVCSTPNCSHQSENCSAYFSSRNISNMAIYNDKLYYWTEDGTSSALWIADKNGENRQEIHTIDKLAPRTNAIYSDQKIFYDTLVEEIDEEREGDAGDYGNYYIRKTTSLAYYDIAAGKEVILGKDRVSYWGSLSLLYYGNGKIYYSYAHLRDGLDDTTYNPTDYDALIDDIVTDYYVIDIDTGEEKTFLSDTIPMDLSFYGKYAAYNEKTGGHYQLLLLDLETMETEIIAESNDSFSSRMLDNKIFYAETGPINGNQKTYYYDMKSREVKEIISRLEPNYQIMILQETSDKFVGTLAVYEDDLVTQVGNSKSIYITKKDYYNGMENYVEITDMG